MIEVLREGEPTMDGRFIFRGAIELPDEPIVVFDWDERLAEDEPRMRGTLFNFARGDDDRIYCDTDVDIGDRLITVSVSIKETEEVAGEVIGVKRARIIGGVIGSDMIYPWK